MPDERFEDDELLTPRRVAAILGLSQRRAYELGEHGAIEQVIQWNGRQKRIFFPGRSVRAYIASGPHDDSYVEQNADGYVESQAAAGDHTPPHVAASNYAQSHAAETLPGVPYRVMDESGPGDLARALALVGDAAARLDAALRDYAAERVRVTQLEQQVATLQSELARLRATAGDRTAPHERARRNGSQGAADERTLLWAALEEGARRRRGAGE